MYFNLIFCMSMKFQVLSINQMELKKCQKRRKEQQSKKIKYMLVEENKGQLIMELDSFNGVFQNKEVQPCVMKTTLKKVMKEII